jgi:hypothetical protein
VDGVDGAEGVHDPQRVGASYADHLTDVDLRVLCAEGRPGISASEAVARLRHDPETIPALLGHPGVFDAIFGEQAVTSGRPLLVSPFLVFAVAVHRAGRDLVSMHHVTERVGLRQRVPVFDAQQLADFLDSHTRRLFLAELLASFTRNAGGRYRVHTDRGWRWRRFNELDPLRLARLLQSAAAEERPGVYRRLGDSALFLTGVFPDYTQDRALSPLDATRLVRVAGVDVGGDPERVAATAPMELFEQLGAGWYHNAWDTAPYRTGQLAVVADVARRFHQARRVLNHITDRYLFPLTAGPGGTPAH